MRKFETSDDSLETFQISTFQILFVTEILYFIPNPNKEESYQKEIMQLHVNLMGIYKST